MNTLDICSTHLSDVATLPWEIHVKFSQDKRRTFFNVNCTNFNIMHSMVFAI